jgi:hypothetical protein
MFMSQTSRVDLAFFWGVSQDPATTAAVATSQRLHLAQQPSQLFSSFFLQQDFPLSTSANHTSPQPLHAKPLRTIED